MANAKQQPGQPADKVSGWRHEQFLGMGFDWSFALQLADARVDVTEMRKLIEGGCEPQTAALILL